MLKASEDSSKVGHGWEVYINLLRRAQLAGLSGQWVALLCDELEYDGQVLSRSAGVAQR